MSNIEEITKFTGKLNKQEKTKVNGCIENKVSLGTILNEIALMRDKTIQINKLQDEKNEKIHNYTTTNQQYENTNTTTKKHIYENTNIGPMSYEKREMVKKQIRCKTEKYLQKK